MHILLIHQAFALPNEPGGTRHYELARYLVRLGHEVTVVTSDVSYLTGTRSSVSSGMVVEAEVDGIRLLRTHTYHGLHRSFFRRVICFLSFMVTSILVAVGVPKIDLVMGTSPPIFQAVSAWLVATIRRRPLLLEIRDLWPEFAIDMGVLRNPLLIKASRWLEAFLYAACDHLLVNSPAYREYLKSKGVPGARISLIPNGVDPALFRPNDRAERIRESFGLDGQFVVTYAGALGLANDIRTVLRTARRLRDRDNIHFLIVGDGKERGELETRARQWGLNNVSFAGPRPKSEMYKILAASDACLATLQDIPMFRTTYPNKVFDYMAAGRPTILAIDGVIRKVVETARGGVFVSPGDDAALAEAICSLREHPDKARAMGKAARGYVVEHFNRRQQARDFLLLVDRLVDNG